MIYIYSDPGSCLLDVWSGKQIISGKTYNGGVKMDRCSFRELFDYFTQQQIEAIDSHIRSKAYDQGCSACKIKKQYDFSMSKDNECRDVYEFPVQTSACVTGNDGKCEWVDVSQRRVQLPGPHDFTTRNPGTVPTEFAIRDPTPAPVTTQSTISATTQSTISATTQNTISATTRSTISATTQSTISATTQIPPTTAQPSTAVSTTTPATQPSTTESTTTTPIRIRTQSTTTVPPTTTATTTTTTATTTTSPTTTTTTSPTTTTTTTPTTTLRTTTTTIRSTTQVKRTWIQHVRVAVRWPTFQFRKRS
ncbi:uncharacterized protein LOC101243301 [Ciona intestinalis]